ncbi:ATP phosphoribosyltransferase regulatory subunit [Bacillus pinisoli]|uniref:ATP phosphoribosyltransferase regulatory subunit n=1 Tax=Bacillus pinisoli TaxID=2901866 RepID=UPI001FF1AFAC|nr:ATP phosphoribosyltransferase regulatory subunit [Bacillus pinisoli]
MFEKPVGMRDTLPHLYTLKKQARNQISSVIEGYGYEFLETPTLEYYETVGESSAILDQQLFKLMDQQGHTLVLRPDMTAPIARLAASRLYTGGYPLRLAYDTNVFRAQQREGGRPAEFEQVGVELIGDRSSSADAEVITLMIHSLLKAGLTEFTVAIGHIGFIDALFTDVLGNQTRVSEIKRFLYEKNYVGYREHVKSLPLSSIDKDRLLSILQLRGKGDILQKASQLVQNEQAQLAVNQLQQLWNALDAHGVTSYVKLDVNLVPHMSYYTGILFEGYSSKVGYPICSGGRYDQLLERFERQADATGFAIRLDYLLEALSETSTTKEVECVVFSQERRVEAIQYATERRQQGKQVVLQDITGVLDIDSFTTKFSEVTYFIGTAGKEKQ